VIHTALAGTAPEQMRCSHVFSCRSLRAQGNNCGDGMLFTGTIRRILSTAALAVFSASSCPAQTMTAPAPRRPQEEAIAAAALPYRVELVSFDNPDAPGVKLAATLTLPPGGGPFPAAILVAGSGRNGRDEDFAGGHKPMWVVADALTRRGYAVLRYDKRGIGQSTGDYNAATTMIFASDAEAAVAYMRSRTDIDPKGLGLIGHSEGANIAAVVAAKDPHLAFIIMLAAFALPGSDLVAEQERRISLADGVAPEAAAQAYDVNIRFYRAIVAARDDTADAQAHVNAVAADPNLKVTPVELKEALHYAELPYMRFILAYDPRPVLRQVRTPVLALNGSKDLIDPPDLSVPALREALARDPDARVVELDGLNHFFQHAGSGSPKEFATIEETIAPEVLTTMTDWLATHAK
jgi:pimeloyl-ACP methyl ester carboxylesterase